MADKFLIKKVNPHVPVFTSYVACRSTAAEAYQLPSDCNCPNCPEPCPELSNILQVNLKNPGYGIEGEIGVSHRFNAMEFWDKYIYPYILQLGGDYNESRYRIYYMCDEPVINNPFDITQLNELGPNNESVVWESTYFLVEENYIDFINAQMIGGVMTFKNFTPPCRISLIFIDEVTGAIYILNNLVRVDN